METQYEKSELIGIALHSMMVKAGIKFHWSLVEFENLYCKDARLGAEKLIPEVEMLIKDNLTTFTELANEWINCPFFGLDRTVRYLMEDKPYLKKYSNLFE